MSDAATTVMTALMSLMWGLVQGARGSELLHRK